MNTAGAEVMRIFFEVNFYCLTSQGKKPKVSEMDQQALIEFKDLHIKNGIDLANKYESLKNNDNQ